MFRLQVLTTLATGAAIAVAALAHQDDPKLRDRQPPVQAEAFRADLNKAPQVRGMFESDGITMLSWLSLSALGGYDTGNDCWGYVSPSGREYAIIGVNSATIFVEVTDPGNATIVGTINGPDSLWRDVKTYQNYCYSVSEGGSGIQVIDMANIDDGVVTLVNTVEEGGTSATHNVVIDVTSGYLYRTGGGSNGLRIYDLNANPAAPAYVGIWSNKYVHDAQVITYPAGTPYAGKEIAFCYAGFNGGWEQTGLTILDVSDKSNIIILGEVQHSNNNYSHQGWLTDDLQYVYLNDELDEQNTNTPTTTRILDVSDLANPVQVGTCSTGLASIDHNLYIHGNRMYQANYRSGLQVFDISDPLNPQRSGWFDTYPGDDGASFNGMWSNYPYLPSGITICSDLERGLFVLSAATIEISLVDNLPQLLSPTDASLQVRIRGLSGNDVDPDTFFLRVNDGTGEQTLPLVPTANPEVWNVNFPDMSCGNYANWHVSATSLTGQTVTLPSGGPSNPYETLVADGIVDSFKDDFQNDLGWTVEVECLDGEWTRGDPVDGQRGDPPADADSSGICFVTDNVIGNSDVDDGLTRLVSPILDASEQGSLLTYWRWYSNDFGASPNEDIFTVDVSDDGGTTWVTLETVGPGGPETSGGWYQKQFEIDTIAGISPTDTFRIRFTAADTGNGSVVEAGVDGVSISSIECEDLEDCPADCANGDGVVDVQDVLEVLAQFGSSGGCDIDGNGVVDVTDVLDVISTWGACP